MVIRAPGGTILVAGERFPAAPGNPPRQRRSTDLARILYQALLLEAQSSLDLSCSKFLQKKMMARP